MALKFKSNWDLDIAQISTLPQFQKAEVRIEDPSLVTTDYNMETGKYTTVGDPVIYSGRARIIGLSAPSFELGTTQQNATSITRVRVQLPLGQEGVRVKRGCQLFVTSAPRNPVLEEYTFTAASDFQGSSAASRTLTFNVDMDSENG